MRRAAAAAAALAIEYDGDTKMGYQDDAAANAVDSTSSSSSTGSTERALTVRATAVMGADNGRFLAPKNKETFFAQFAQTYRLRTSTLSCVLTSLLRLKQTQNAATERILFSCSDFKPNETAYLIGCVGRLIRAVHETFTNGDFAPLPPREAHVKLIDPINDSLFLEDVNGGRITMATPPGVKIDLGALNHGACIAVKGKEETLRDETGRAVGARMLVYDLVMPGFAPVPPIQLAPIGPKILFLSGLRVSDDAFSISFLENAIFPRNSEEERAVSVRNAGITALIWAYAAPAEHDANNNDVSAIENYIASDPSVVRVVIAGNTFSISGTTNKKPSARLATMAALRRADNAIARLARRVRVDLLPGWIDSTAHLPRAPIHRFALSESSACHGTFYPCTDPVLLTTNGAVALVSSGEPVLDLLRYTTIISPTSAMEQSMRQRLVIPTAPETLNMTPMTDQQTDPFVLTQTPHVYYAGNQERCEIRNVRTADGKSILLLSGASFAATRTAILCSLSLPEPSAISLLLSPLEHVK